MSRKRCDSQHYAADDYPLSKSEGSNPLLLVQSLDKGFSGLRSGFGLSPSLPRLSCLECELEGGSDSADRPAGSAGVPIPEPGNGLTSPLGGTGILMSSGEPGMILEGTPEMLMRLASFW